MLTSRGMKANTGRGFSLIELLVVMFIIGLVVAITIPALGYARTLAKKTTTQTFMTGMSQACSVFQNDNRRIPGYFSPRDMGSQENIANGSTGGFTAMDNVLLDLSGGVTTAAANGTSIFSFGPTATARVNVDLDKIGVASGSNKLYWSPDAKYYEIQSANSKKGDPINQKLKSVIDGFGQPLAFWGNDDASIAPILAGGVDKFANDHAGANNSTPAKYYWASNSAYLTADALGRKAKDQANLSMIGGVASITEKRERMAAYLGNPSAIANPADPSTSWLPSAGRGKFMIHSAGADGVFLSKDDSGFKKHNTAAGFTFAANFTAGSTKPIDIASDFDDLLVAGGN